MNRMDQGRVESVELNAELSRSIPGTTTVDDPRDGGIGVDPASAMRKPERQEESFSGEDGIGWAHQDPAEG